MSDNDTSPWHPEEDHKLVVAYQAGGIELAVARFRGRRSPAEIQKRVTQLDLERSRPWDNQDLVGLMRLPNDPDAMELFAVSRGRSLRAVKERFKRLHSAHTAPKTTNPRGKLPPAEAAALELIRMGHPTTGLDDEGPPFTEKEDYDLRVAYRAGGDDLAVLYFEGQRSPAQVVLRAIELNLQRGRAWDVKDKLDLLETEGNRDAMKQLARTQGRTLKALVARYNLMHKVKKPCRVVEGRGKYDRWTPVDNDWLRRHYRSSTAEQLLARFTNRTLSAIRIRASELGLTLSRSKAGRLARERAALGSAGPRAVADASEPDDHAGD